MKKKLFNEAHFFVHFALSGDGYLKKP